LNMTNLYPWLEPYRASLAAVLEQGRFPHALLLTGQPGMGKATFCDYLAKMLLCEHPSEDHIPCGTCPGCIQFEAGTHADYFHVHPEVDEKTGKESKAIKVDQIRELAERLSLSSHRGGYKVAVLNPAEAMNINAANSLLKTLEEPPLSADTDCGAGSGHRPRMACRGTAGPGSGDLPAAGQWRTTGRTGTGTGRQRRGQAGAFRGAGRDPRWPGNTAGGCPGLEQGRGFAGDSLAA
jgi:hypothetical protein